jgi:putative PEP-CTERM system TPR-repeat lipoprotein
MASRHMRRALLTVWLALAAACRPSPDELLADARTAFAAGEARTAEIHLKDLLQQEPDNAAARLLLGQVSAAAGDFAAAEQSLRRALALGADAQSVQLPLVQSLVGQGKFQDALAQLAAGPAVADGDRVLALQLEAQAHLRLGAREPAEAAYRAALRIDPQSIEVRTELAALLLESGRANEGRAAIDEVLAEDASYAPALLLRGSLETASGRPADAEATLQRVVELEAGKTPRSLLYVRALTQLAELQLSQDKVDAAAASADTLLAAIPQSPISRYVKAAVEVRQGEIDGAERRLESVVADFPEYWPAYRLLGAINVTQGQSGQATMYLRTVVNNVPTDAAARVGLAELYIREGNVDAAKELMGSAPSTDLNDGLFFAFAARASQQAGLTDQAARFFDQSEQAVPDDVRQLVDLSRMYTAAGEFERAVRVLQSASFDDTQSEQLRNYLLALMQARQGDLAAAKATAQSVVAAQPSAAWPLNLSATIAMLGGDFPSAQQMLERALELEPRNVGALLNAARAAAARNQLPQAEQYLRRVLDAEPGNTTAPIGLAELAAGRRDFAAAQSWVERLPESALRTRLEGELLAAQGRFGDAAGTFARAYEAQPSAELALRAYDTARRAGQQSPETKLLAWDADHPTDPTSNFALGSLALEKGEEEPAIRRYETVLAANPQHAATLNNLAWLYSQRGDARALDFAERAYAAEPNNPAIADTLGWLYVQAGNAAKGLPLLESAAAGLTGQAEVQYHWAVALAETGDRAKALATLDAALATGQEFSARDDAQRRAAALRAGDPR